MALAIPLITTESLPGILPVKRSLALERYLPILADFLTLISLSGNFSSAFLTLMYFSAI